MCLQNVIILLLLQTIKSLKINCNDYNIQNWSCNELLYHLSSTNIEDTFYCIEYNRHETPFKTVVFEREILDLLSVDEVEGYVSIYEKLTILFNDSRLAFDNCPKFKLQFFGDQTHNFWNPDFDTSYDTLLKPKLDKITLTKEGQVKMRNINKQISIKCAMNYKWYPFDYQICKHRILLDEQNLDFQFDVKKALEKSKFTDNPDWKAFLRKGNCNGISKQICFSLDLVLKRKISNHIFHTFIPSILLALASTTSLYIPSDHMPARMSLSVTASLSMITLFVK